MIKKLISKYKSRNMVVCSMSMPDSLQDLIKTLNEPLPSWEPTYAGNGNRIVEIESETGKGTLYGLDDTPAANCAKGIIDAGTVFDWHSHQENEYIIMIKGEQHFHFMDGTTVKLIGGMSFMIPAGVNHKATFPKRVEEYVIGIPPIPGFPAGGRFSDEREKYGIS